MQYQGAGPYVKGTARRHLKRKLKFKSSQEQRPDKSTGITIEEAMAELPNDTFFTAQFKDNHISRDAPNEDYALAVAGTRGGPPSTTVFLEGDDYQALADDIRSFHSAQFRRKGDWTLFTTDKTYPYIDVTAGALGSVASAVTWGRIRFGMRKVGDVNMGSGKSKAPVYACSHLEQMYPTGQNDEDRVVNEEQDARSDSETSDGED